MTADDDRFEGLDEALAQMGRADGQGLRMIVRYYAEHPEQLAELAEAREKGMAPHVYLSTACLHDQHLYCQSMTGYQGAKRPGQCKFCDAQCVCPCHRGL